MHIRVYIYIYTYVNNTCVYIYIYILTCRVAVVSFKRMFPFCYNTYLYTSSLLFEKLVVESLESN